MNFDRWLAAGWFVVMTAAVLFRAAHSTDSLWLDELHTAWCCTGDWQDVAPRAWIGNQSPAYFFMARASLVALGHSEIALRLPSLLAGTLLVPLLGWLMHRWTRSAVAGLVAGALTAIDPRIVYYSQEARPYALLLLVAWLHVAVVETLARRSTVPLRIAFVTGLVAMFHLHYTSALFIVGEVTFLAWMSIRSSPHGYRFRDLLLDLALSSLACLPVAWHLLAILAHRNDWLSFVPPPSWRGLVQLYRLNVYLLLPLAAWLAALIFAEARPRPSSNTAPPDPPAEPGASRCALLLVCLLAVPAVLAWGSTQSDFARLFYPRYLLPAYVAAIAGSAAACATVPQRWLRTVSLIAILSTSLATSSQLRPSWDGEWLVAARRQDWRAAVDFVNSHQRVGNEAAFVRSGLLEADRLRDSSDRFLREYCLAPVNSLYPLQIPAVPLPTTYPTRFEPGILETIEQQDRVFFLFTGSAKSPPLYESAMSRMSPGSKSGWELSAQQSFGQVYVLGFSRRRPAP